MKKRQCRTADPLSEDAGEALPEYDFSNALPNKFAARYVKDSAVIVLDPDVAAAFPTAGQANDALRTLAGLIHKHHAGKRVPD